jgi:hypothetical protein
MLGCGERYAGWVVRLRKTVGFGQLCIREASNEAGRRNEGWECSEEGKRVSDECAAGEEGGARG